MTPLACVGRDFVKDKNKPVLHFGNSQTAVDRISRSIKFNKGLDYAEKQNLKEYKYRDEGKG